MKTKIALITLGITAAMTSSVFAGDIKPLHTCVQSGLYTQSLGSSATAKDIWQVTCPTGTKYFEAQVRDRAPVATPILSINVTASSTAGTTNGVRTDTVDANGGTIACDLTGFSSYSRRTLTTASAAPVTFTFEVYKDAVGAEDYDVSEHCGKTTVPTDLGNGTSLTNLQNQ